MSPRRVETPADVKEARNRLGFTQEELAKALRLGEYGKNTVSAWERGKRQIPGPESVAIELMLMLQERER